MNQLTISLPGDGVGLELLASLPISFRRADAEPDVALVDGGPDGWTESVSDALQTGARAVVVLDPVITSADAIRQLASDASQAGKSVILSETWAGNPIVADVRSTWGPHLRATDFLEVFSVVGAEVEEAFFRQLRVLRNLGFAPPTFSDVVTGRGGLLGTGTLEGRAVSACVAVSAIGDGTLSFVANGPDDQVTLKLPSSATARPALAALVTVEGAQQRPTLWETAHRASWRRVHRMITDGIADVSDLQAFAEDVETCLAALDHRAK
jgi:hypothetical protein